MSKKKDLTGQIFGRLTVLRPDPAKTRTSKWICLCSCGETTSVRTYHLTGGRVRSCGCLSRDKAKAKAKVKNDKRLWYVWRGMKERCRNPRHIGWKRYGGRGIKVCEAWQDFDAFRSWALANGYRDDLTIDRIDNDGDYCPENCRWSTFKEQARHTSRSRIIKGKTLAEWVEITGIPRSCIVNRIDRANWDIERALTTPVITKFRRKE